MSYTYNANVVCDLTVVSFGVTIFDHNNYNLGKRRALLCGEMMLGSGPGDSSDGWMEAGQLVVYCV